MSAEQVPTQAVDKGTPANRRRYTVEEKLALVTASEAWTGTMEAFCTANHVSVPSLFEWRRAYRALGPQGLQPLQGRSRRRRGHQGPYSQETRQQAVEAFQKSGLPINEFAKVWKVTPKILEEWVKRYEAEGSKGLLGSKSRGKRGRPPLPKSVTDRIVAVKKAFPEFGFKRVRGFLGRFRGLHVSVGTVRKSVAAAGLPATPEPAKRHKKRPRFFERASPGSLWQSDWTSFVMPRNQQRVFLIVFLDDHSRYVVSWGLHLGQRSEHVVEALREGMSRFGKPTEVLTDQGPQYFAWRGTSEFQQFLKREGIRHVVARTHHPQTLGKCERFWGTVAEEFWPRIPPVELPEIRVRFAHFVAHYNHFRPHQGIENLVPADKFFGASSSVRQTLESAFTTNELHLAVDEAPRSPVYLTGQIGDTPVSLVGEKGKLVFHSADGHSHELTYDALGMAPGAGKDGHDGGNGGSEGTAATGAGHAGNGADTAGPAGEAQVHVQDAATGGAGEEPAAEREPGGAAAGAPDRDRDPGDVAGAQDPERGGQIAGVAGGAHEAALGSGAVGDGGGTAQTAPAEGERPDAAGREPAQAPATGGGAAEGNPDTQGVGDAPPGPASEQGAGEATT